MLNVILWLFFATLCGLAGYGTARALGWFGNAGRLIIVCTLLFCGVVYLIHGPG